MRLLLVSKDHTLENEFPKLLLIMMNLYGTHVLFSENYITKVLAEVGYSLNMFVGFNFIDDWLIVFFY